SEGLIQMRGTTSPRLLLELMCAQVLLPAASTGEKALLARLERLEHQLAGVESGPGEAADPRGGRRGGPVVERGGPARGRGGPGGGPGRTGSPGRTDSRPEWAGRRPGRAGVRPERTRTGPGRGPGRPGP